MSDLVYDDRNTRRTKEALLSAGLLAPLGAEPTVPEVIERSWRRCLSVAVPSARVAVPYLDVVDRHGPLADAARPVFERIGAHLSGSGVALFLSDNKGQIVLRQIEDRRQRDVYDNASAAEGFDFSENAIGTNGLGTVIEERQPVFVRGCEHFNEALEPLACAGVPIFKPYTRQVVGSFALACRSESVNTLMYAMALDVGRQIETCIASMQGDRERALAQAYLTANQSRRDPVIVVSERAALANTIGLHYLSNESHALLWQYLLTHPSSDVPTRASVPVAGARRDAIVERIIGVGDDATYLLRLLPVPGKRPSGAPIRAGDRGPHPRVGRSTAPVNGSSHSADVVEERLATAAESARWVVIDGASGTGKRTAGGALLRRLGYAGDPLVVDLSFAAREGRGWYWHAVEAHKDRRGVILTHLQDLPRRQANLVKAIAAAPTTSAGEDEPLAARARPLVATVTLADSPPHVVSLVRQLATPVELPTLRVTKDRIPELVGRILAELPLYGHPSFLTTGALQALMRWAWPGNIGELRRTVEQAAQQAPGRGIDSCHLPPHIQAAARGRSLSVMESAERDAIIATLHRLAGNRTKAAAALGIGRTTLYRKLRTYRIQA